MCVCADFHLFAESQDINRDQQKSHHQKRRGAASEGIGLSNDEPMAPGFSSAMWVEQNAVWGLVICSFKLLVSEYILEYLIVRYESHMEVSEDIGLP